MLTKHAAHRKDLSGKPATFTHQHFRKVAEIIRNMGPVHIPGASPSIPNLRPILAEVFAEELAYTNPNFDRHRFLMACQPTEN
jgi:hypothetical protein